jgi:alanine racemase
MKILASDLAKITCGKLYGPGGHPVHEVITDSRQSGYSEGQVFFAIRGVNHDGHQFVTGLYEKGIRIFVIDQLKDEYKRILDASFIICKDTVNALQRLASFRRSLFLSPVIAVTGSTGKTIVKEWLADVLGLKIPVIRSPKSYNSQIGVPLSVLKLDEKYKLGIFEAGISKPDEMEKLERVIKPDIGVFTNIGEAHSENFPDNRAKAAEKIKLFTNTSMIVFCHDDELIRDMIYNSCHLRAKKLIDWSLENKGARIFVRKIPERGNRTTIRMLYNSVTNDFTIPFTDRASIENAITVASVCLAIGTEPEIIAEGLKSLVSVAMRMEIKSGINNCRLIEDYYNSDPGSLGMALEFLKSQKGRKNTLILSDFVQSGRPEKELYGEVADQIRDKCINRFIGIGKSLTKNSGLFGGSSRFFESTGDFISSFNSADFRDEIILLKGARIYEFEKIANLLEEQTHQTVLEINLDAFSHNLNEFRRVLNPGTKIMAMVKAFAYGAGPAEIAGLLEFHRIAYLGVAYADEGMELRNAGVTMPIIVMNPDPASFDLMIRNSLEPEIYSFGSLEKFITVASRHGLLYYPVHIKIDTGMHRLGFMPEEVPEMAKKIKNTEWIKINSVFSHLAGSDDPALDGFTLRQAEVFIGAANQISDTVGYSFLRHILNSSGIARFPQYQFEMVRPGIGMYGVGKFEGLSLRTTGRFKTRISQIKKIKAGEPVGYGCADTSGSERIIAILPVGYADGFSRLLGNSNGSLFINGRRAPVVGNVCMDMCMADITGINANEGDEAEIFGDNIKIEEIAEKCQTIPYEILTSIPRRVKRVFFRE